MLSHTILLFDLQTEGKCKRSYKANGQNYSDLGRQEVKAAMERKGAIKVEWFRPSCS